MMPKRRGTLPGWVGGALWALVALTVVGLLSIGPLATGATAAPSAAIVVDAKTGKVLYSSNADAPRHPASLTKMMTLYLLFEAIESGRTSLNDTITMSSFAASQAPSKLGLKPGQTIKVRDAILAIVTKSANDIAVAIGEHLDGSEKAFAAHMTRRARELGMTRTTYVNASGLPDNRQVTSARDLSILSRALRDHYPQYYSYFSTPSFVWRGRRIANHDHLLGRVNGVNGIKTGYTRASGYNLATSLDRDGRKVVAIVLGGATGGARDRRMMELLEAYLPKASAGPRTVAMIRSGPGARATSGSGTVVARSDAPVPNLRPTADTDVADASDPTDDAADPMPPSATVASAVGSTTIADLVAGANSVFALDAVDTASTGEGDANADDDPSDTSAPAPATTGGWRIQLAASPTKGAAEEVLDEALSKAGAVLADAAPYTEAVTTGSTTLYRARFAGFSDKASARAACAYLVKRDFDCLAVAN